MGFFVAVVAILTVFFVLLGYVVVTTKRGEQRVRAALAERPHLRLAGTRVRTILGAQLASRDSEYELTRADAPAVRLRPSLLHSHHDQRAIMVQPGGAGVIPEGLQHRVETRPGILDVNFRGDDSRTRERPLGNKLRWLRRLAVTRRKRHLIQDSQHGRMNRGMRNHDFLFEVLRGSSRVHAPALALPTSGR